MKAKAPYSFPARSRAAMVSAIVAIGHRRYYRPEAWPFCWDVKLDWFPSKASELAPFYAEEPLDPQLDSEWDSYCDNNDGLFWHVANDMAESFIESEYSTYPGDDAGQFSFGFEGRSGGWLILKSAYGQPMAGLDLESLSEADSGWSFAAVRRLYKALICMDSDFAREKVKAEYFYNLGYRRARWESELRDKQASLRADIVANRATLRELCGALKGAAGTVAPVIESTLRERIATLAKATRAKVAELNPQYKEVI